MPSVWPKPKPFVRVLLISRKNATDFAVHKELFAVCGAEVSSLSVQDGHLGKEDAMNRIVRFLNKKADVPIKVIAFVGDGQPETGDWIFVGGNVAFNTVLDLQKASPWQGELLVYSNSTHSGILCSLAAHRGAKVCVQASRVEPKEGQDHGSCEQMLSSRTLSFTPTHGIREGSFCIFSLLQLATCSQDLQDKKTRGVTRGAQKLDRERPQQVWLLAVWKERNTGRSTEEMTHPLAKTTRILLLERMASPLGTRDPLWPNIELVRRFRLFDDAAPEGADPKTAAHYKKQLVVRAGEHQELTTEMILRLQQCFEALIRDIIPRGKRKPELALFEAGLRPVSSDHRDTQPEGSDDRRGHAHCRSGSRSSSGSAAGDSQTKAQRRPDCQEALSREGSSSVASGSAAGSDTEGTGPGSFNSGSLSSRSSNSGGSMTFQVSLLPHEDEDRDRDLDVPSTPEEHFFYPHEVKEWQIRDLERRLRDIKYDVLVKLQDRAG